jgi:hypothetical protein
MPTRTPIDALLKHMGTGSTGALSVDVGESRVRVHLIHGEIVAATSGRDTSDILHRLVHAGALDPESTAGLEAALAEGATMSGLLAGSVSYDTILTGYAARFEENLARFLLAQTPVRFEVRPAGNTRLPRFGAHPADLVLRVRSLAERARDLLEAAGTRRLVPGPAPASREDAGLVALVGDGARVRDVLEDSPDQPVVTAARLRGLLDLGVLAAVQDEDPVGDAIVDAPDPTLVEASVEQRFSVDPDRPAGLGEFVVEKHLLDYVDLESSLVEGPTGTEDDLVLAMEDGESDRAGRSGAVTLALSGPALKREEALRKAEVTNEVLREIAAEFQEAEGPGAGWARIQALLQGSPMKYRNLFRGVVARRDGSMDAEMLVQNLQKRPGGEQRRSLNDALQDLVERSLTLAAESIDGPRLDGMLDRIAGFQKRLGL